MGSAVQESWNRCSRPGADVARVPGRAVSGAEKTFLRQAALRNRQQVARVYFGAAGAGVNTSRFRPGSGFGLGLGAFFCSFLPLSLFPMRASMTQLTAREKAQRMACGSMFLPRKQRADFGRNAFGQGNRID